MTAKKKKTVKRIRDPYLRAFNAAQKRLEKANSEKTRCEARLAFLKVEIPKLQQIIQVLGPKSGAAPARIPIPAAPPAPAIPAFVPDELKHFMKPNDQVETPPPPMIPNEDDPDAFLPDTDQHGKAILE